MESIDRYVDARRKEIEGWLARTDAEILKCILLAQNKHNIVGAVAEIGVHHGKTFVLLCLGRKASEKSYCIDIFEHQHLNRDSSGRGDRSDFEKALERFEVRNNVVIDNRSSEMVKANDILESVGDVRLFSVDGGHWTEIVVNDLLLAEATLGERGVIALDDFHRSEWPNVSEGYFKWFSNRKKPIFPFAIGFNKLYLCNENDLAFYQKALAKNETLAPFQTKQIEFQGIVVPVYQTFMLAEHSGLERLKGYLKLYHPEAFLCLRNWLKWVR